MATPPNASCTYSNMAASKGIVFHDPSIESVTGFDAAWEALSIAQKKERLVGLLPALVLRRIDANRLGYMVRIVVDFAGPIPNKPKIMRWTERNLREVLGVDLELVGEFRRDTSPLRRLTLKEVGHE